MTSFVDLRTALSRALRDPGADTFVADTLNDLINTALVEVGRIAPTQFKQDITPVADTIAYRLRSDVFSVAIPEIEVTRVEFWDNSVTPPRALFTVRPRKGEWSRATFAGWEVWNGTLNLTNDQAVFLDPARHVIKVWGYSPYPPLVNDNDILPVSFSLEKALIAFCRVEALRRLSISRDLFTQWQSQPNNSDVSPAGLLSALANAEDEWKRRSRQLTIIR